MYGTAEATLQRILELVDKCPNSLKEQCFEILLRGYVEAELARRATPPPRERHDKQPDTGDRVLPGDSSIPPELAGRFKNAAKRLGIELAQLEALFDFSGDVVQLHAVEVAGDSKAERTRKVALLVAAKSYLTTGNWAADWKEVKARVVDQNCYDAANHAQFLKKDPSKLFRSIETGKNLELSSTGVKEAEALLKALATAG